MWWGEFICGLPEILKSWPSVSCQMFAEASEAYVPGGMGQEGRDVMVNVFM